MSMNVTPHIPQVVVNASAPSTEALVKANAVKEVVPATVQTEAIVPQKTREQEARGSVNNTSNSDTYEGIQEQARDNRIIPEDEQQSDSQDEQQQNSQTNDEPSSEQEEQAQQENNGQEQQEKAEQQQQEAKEQKVIDQLEMRDREVRAHEQAHAAIGGSLAGAPSYEFQTGPDGKKYAVGGEVSIDVSKTNDPESTIRKMQTVRAAALAPAEPSSQDRKVAAEASQNIAEARAEMISDNSSLKSADEVKQKVSVEIENINSDDNDISEQSNNSELATSEITDSSPQPITQPNKMPLAQQFVSSENDNKTAQVISQKYAAAVEQKENFFNAVA